MTSPQLIRVAPASHSRTLSSDTTTHKTDITTESQSNTDIDTDLNTNIDANTESNVDINLDSNIGSNHNPSHSNHNSNIIHPISSSSLHKTNTPTTTTSSVSTHSPNNSISQPLSISPSPSPSHSITTDIDSIPEIPSTSPKSLILSHSNETNNEHLNDQSSHSYNESLSLSTHSNIDPNPASDQRSSLSDQSSNIPHSSPISPVTIISNNSASSSNISTDSSSSSSDDSSSISTSSSNDSSNLSLQSPSSPPSRSLPNVMINRYGIIQQLPLNCTHSSNVTNSNNVNNTGTNYIEDNGNGNNLGVICDCSNTATVTPIDQSHTNSVSPSKIELETLQQQKEVEFRKRVALTELDQKREIKWLQMLANWNKFSYNKVKSRVRKGIPDSLRATLWPRFAGALDLICNEREQQLREREEREKKEKERLEKEDREIEDKEKLSKNV
jgi:hypothetical protein